MKMNRPRFRVVAGAALLAALALSVFYLWLPVYEARNAASATAITKVVPIAIVVTADGRISVEGSPDGIDELRNILRASSGPRSVNIRTHDTNAAYKAINDVLNMCGEFGVRQVGFKRTD